MTKKFSHCNFADLNELIIMVLSISFFSNLQESKIIKCKYGFHADSTIRYS